MKILAIGGSGGMGRFAVDAAQHFNTVERIEVADLNEASAQNFAAQLNNKVNAIGLDVSDDAAQGHGECRFSDEHLRAILSLWLAGIASGN